MTRNQEISTCPKCSGHKSKIAKVCYRCRGHNRIAREATLEPAIQRKEINHIVNSIKISPKMTNEEKNVIFRNRVLVCLLYLTSARISEVLSLKKSNFDFNTTKSTNYLIRKMKNQKNKKNPTKIIPIPKSDKFSKDIKLYVERLPKENSYLFYQRKKVFGWTYERINKPMHRSTAFRIIKKIDPDIWCHWFRHQRLSHLAENLTDRQLIGISGHRSSQNLEHYVRLNPSAYENLIPTE